MTHDRKARAHEQTSAREGWEALFWLVFERSSNPIILLDDARLILDVNAAALALFDYERDEVLGTSIIERIAPSERFRAAREWQDLLRSGSYSGSRAMLRADGSAVPISFAARLTRIGGRRVAVYVAMTDDAGRESTPAAREPPLTRREREIVTLISLGYDTAEIAGELHIANATVRTHVRNAMSKLGARTRAQLVATVLCNEQAVHVTQLHEPMASGSR
ncbi:MAG TPA: LuxR C-terminal-related transcriptional regulator [Solirubrobacteraceae bacterium]|nr:LuxR C-terminal-related transcriptional regulator [Solirubrobacteraceae bacterium]